MSHTEADRQAFYKDLAEKDHIQEVKRWLAANPDVGELCGKKTKYYRMIDNKIEYTTVFN